MPQKNIVIIGGGFAGIGIASDLQKRLTNKSEYSIILIEKKSHFYHCIGGVRSAVEDIDKKLLVPYTNLFKGEKRHRVIQASAIKIEKRTVHLDKPVDGSTELPFEYLILAPGTLYPAPCKLPTTDYDESIEYLASLRERIKKAKSLVLVGGGPVGVELVGELSDVYKNTKKVTIVHDQPAFLDDTIPDKVRARFYGKIKAAGVEIILNDTVLLPGGAQESVFAPEGPLTTKGGKTIEAELAILTFGNRPNTAWIKATAPELVADNGYIRCKPTLQVDAEGWDRVFVIGDAADVKETKQAARVHSHVAVLGANVQAIIDGRTPSKTYKPGPPVMLVTFGKKQGGGVLPLPIFNTINDFFASLLKGKTLMTGMTWKNLNATEPK